MPFIDCKPYSECMTFNGTLEKVKTILDSPQHKNTCRLLGVVKSYWEGRECLRLDMHRAKDKAKLCSIHASATDEVVTLFADEYGIHPEVLRSITAQITMDIYHSQHMYCIKQCTP